MVSRIRYNTDIVRSFDHIFRNASVTYYFSSLFFSPGQQRAVSRLYAFVRLADDYVDDLPQDPVGFAAFCKRYYSKASAEIPAELESALLQLEARAGSSEEHGGLNQETAAVIESFAQLQQSYGFEQRWVDAFLLAMALDFFKDNYRTQREIELYMLGSAEVIGLMMSKILHVPRQYWWAARLMGRCMQYANFIRDVDEDQKLGRRYLPNLSTQMQQLTAGEMKSHPLSFDRFMQEHIDLYRNWARQAEQGLSAIPWPARVAVRTAHDKYRWTVRQIEREPQIVFRSKVKPTPWEVIWQGLKNVVR